MARRPGERRELNLSPRARRIAGWIAAVALVGGIALGVRIVGGSGDGSPAAADSSPSGSATSARPITFGTALDSATGLVATPARTSRFGQDETFAYSVADLPPPGTVYVEVERVGGGASEVVQERAPQSLGPDATALAFTVPAAALLDAFGPGEYRMRIYLAAETLPAAEGTFVLVATGGVSPAPSS